MRILYLNNTYMNVYSKINDFKSCYNLAKSQYLSLKGIGKKTEFNDDTLAYLTVSCIAMKRYSEIISLLEDKIKLPRTMLATGGSAIDALYMLKEKEYEESMTELFSKVEKKESETLKALDLYLKKQDDKSLKIIENAGLKMNFSGALKMIFKQ